MDKNKETYIKEKILGFVKTYVEMEVLGLRVHCPYFMNKMKLGVVILRGFLNGKGSAQEIQKELVKRISVCVSLGQAKQTPHFVQVFARRERIGIDCSGFAYRFLDELVRLKYKDVSFSSLESVFVGGINKTNVRRLVNSNYSLPVKRVDDIQLGDFISIWKNKHVLVVLEKTEESITYVHSSFRSTREKGVHIQRILLNADSRDLEDQEWLEKTSKGENYKNKYFYKEAGDGIYRLKIFN